jgi:hypothetical protein
MLRTFVETVPKRKSHSSQAIEITVTVHIVQNTGIVALLLNSFDTEQEKTR